MGASHATTYVYHEGREAVSRVLALNFESSLGSDVSVLRRQQLDQVEPQDLIITAGLDSFKNACNTPSLAHIAALFIGEQEYNSSSESCRERSVAVFSGAPLALRIGILDTFWEDRAPITLIHSRSITIDTEELIVAAKKHNMDVKTVAVAAQREAALRTLTQVTLNSNLVMSIYDSELFDGQFSKDAIRLMFHKKKALAAHSLQLVKAGAIFAVYSTTAAKIAMATQHIKYFQSAQAFKPSSYPDSLRVVFNPYLVRMYGLVLPTDIYLYTTFGVCPELGCEEAFD